MVFRILSRGVVILALVGTSKGVNLGFRPNPELSPWAEKEETRTQFENSPWESVRAQKVSMEFDDNQELNSIHESMAEAQSGFNASVVVAKDV